MSVLVTGTPGAGKSALVTYAQHMGDRRFADADEIQGLCEWRDLATGQAIGLTEHIPATGGDAWYRQYGWYWRPWTLQRFLTANATAIVCGSAENVVDCYSMFEKIIVLRKTQTELLANLASPDRTNMFGRTTEQRSGFMRWQAYLLYSAYAYDCHVIDGNDTVHTYQAITENSIQKTTRPAARLATHDAIRSTSHDSFPLNQ